MCIVESAYRRLLRFFFGINKKDICENFYQEVSQISFLLIPKQNSKKKYTGQSWHIDGGPGVPIGPGAPIGPGGPMAGVPKCVYVFVCLGACVCVYDSGSYAVCVCVTGYQGGADGGGACMFVCVCVGMRVECVCAYVCMSLSVCVCA